MASQDPRGALDCHALGQAGAHQAVVTPQRPVNHNRNFPLDRNYFFLFIFDCFNYDLSVGQVHGEAPERLAALAEAAGGVLLRQEYLMAEPIRHLKLILTLVPTGTGASLCILGKLKVHILSQ